MHVLILNQTFYPDVAATAQLMWDLARHLDAHGHRVTALTSNYFYGTDREHASRYERHNNIEIVRVRQTGFGKAHLLGRMMDFASFYVSAAWELARRPSPDVILVLTSPPMISTLAALAKQFFRKPDGSSIRVVYHVMDLYPDAAIAPGVIGETSILARILGRLTERTLAQSDAVIALGRDMRDRILRKYPRGAKADRIHVIRPWAEADFLRPLSKSDNALARELGVVDTFNLVYSGNLGIAHDLDTMLDAIERTRTDPGLRWIFIGAGKRFEILKQRFDQAKWPHVILLPHQDHDRLNLSLNLADVHLVSQLPAFTGVVVPSKLFGILAVGKPTLMIGPPDVECSRIVDEHAIGYVVPVGDAETLLKRIEQMRNDPDWRRLCGDRARRAFEQEFSCSVACEQLRAVLEHRT